MNASGTANWSYRLDVRNLAAGIHRVEARAVEPELESEITAVDFEIKKTTDVPADEKVDYLLVGFLLGVAVLAAGLSAYVVLRKRKIKRGT